MLLLKVSSLFFMKFSSSEILRMLIDIKMLNLLFYFPD